MEAGSVGFDCESFLNLIESCGSVPLGCGYRREKSEGLGIIGLNCKDRVCLIFCTRRLAASQEQVTEIKASLNVIWLKIDSFAQLHVGRHCRPIFQIDLSELVMCFGKIAINLQCVCELDRGFFKLSFVRIAFAALKIFLLLNIRVAMAAE